MINKKKVVLVAGGTGGHLFPATALSKLLQENGVEVILLTDKRVQKFIRSEDFNKVVVVPSVSWNIKKPLKMFLFCVSLVKAFIVSFFYLVRIKPSVVVGFGGYPTVAPMIAAIVQRRKTVIQEQNAVIGRANRLLSSFVTLIILTFKTKNILYPKKTICIGMPIRKVVFSVLPAPYKKSLKNEDFHLLVFGGSQGAGFFAEIFPQAFELLSKQDRERLIITQQARDEDIQKLQQQYKRLSLRHEVSTFFHNLPLYIKKSHFVVSRSGASTIVELKIISRPALLVPYPHALEQDQLLNAKAMSSQGEFSVVLQADLTPDKLCCVLQWALNNPDQLAQKSRDLSKHAPEDATPKFYDIILKLILGKSVLPSSQE